MEYAIQNEIGSMTRFQDAVYEGFLFFKLKGWEKKISSEFNSRPLINSYLTPWTNLKFVVKSTTDWIWIHRGWMIWRLLKKTGDKYFSRQKHIFASLYFFSFSKYNKIGYCASLLLNIKKLFRNRVFFRALLFPFVSLQCLSVRRQIN